MGWTSRRRTHKRHCGRHIKSVSGRHAGEDSPASHSKTKRKRPGENAFFAVVVPVRFWKGSVMKRVWAYRMAGRLWQWCAARIERLCGVDFSGWETMESLGFDAQRGNQYQPSARGIEALLKKLPITPGDAVIDIGCGKGKAMYLLGRLPFRTVAGIEISPVLCKTARKNLKRLGMENSYVFCGDAAEFEGYDEYNYFYMFNALPAPVFARALGKIEKSLSRRPRKAWFIYLNPECHDLLARGGGFRLIKTRRHPIRWFRCNCYVHEPEKNV